MLNGKWTGCMGDSKVYILCIETGTDVCSVGLVADGRIVSIRESNDGRDHARRVAVFTEEVLEEAGIAAAELSAVAVGKGPGSYTGLRIGVSFAKGLCYGLGVPLIRVGSLESLCETAMAKINENVCFRQKCPDARLATEPNEEYTRTYVTNSASSITPQAGVFHGNLFIPMIDARRMEVYGQVFDPQGTALTGPEALIVDEGSLAQWRSRNADGEPCGENTVYIFGSGAEKCREVLPWAHYIEVRPSARGMVRLAAEALAAGRTEDVAYFEPLYLKDFVVTTTKKKIF